MSCHDIGRGMASVANVVIELYKGGQIGKDAANYALSTLAGRAYTGATAMRARRWKPS